MKAEEKTARREYFEGLSSRQQRAFEKANDWKNLHDPRHNAALVERARKRMERVDSMPEDVRQVVYDYGLEIVWELWTYKTRRASVMVELIKAVQGAENPHSSSVKGRFLQRGIGSIKGANHLIDTILGADFPNGSPRFKLNKGPNAKQNPANYDDDDECYYVLGPVVTGGAP